MVVDFYASHRHLVDHLAPIWHVLELDERGTFHAAHRGLVAYCEQLGITARWSVPQMPGPFTVVANHGDYSQVHPKRDIGYLEHGAGQTYVDYEWHPSYSGGSHRDRVGLFLTLNETTAARERATYPDAHVEIVGSPRLDALASQMQPRAGDRAPVLACAWHWRCPITPETRTGFDYWRHTFADLAKTRTVLGHGHPRIIRELVPWYERHGIEPVVDSAEVLERADVLCFDNTSFAFEAAALGIPVVALNAPFYRRDVHHGLRFWDMVPGPQADTPPDLLPAIDEAQTDEWARRRAEITDLVYPPHTRGRAAQLAAAAIRCHASMGESGLG